MSDKYANASIIIPQVMCIIKTVANKDTRKVLKGLGGTINKVVEGMNNRYAVYLHNPNLMLATFFDPRYKHCPFKKEPYNLDAVEKLVVERYLEHEKEKKLYAEENNGGEALNSSSTQEVADVVMVDEGDELLNTSSS